MSESVVRPEIQVRSITRQRVIDDADRRLRVWVQTVLDGVPISLGPPLATQPGRGVNLYLLELLSRPPSRGATPPPLQMTLSYLVTTWAEEPEEAHRLLGDLAFAAMDSPDLEVVLEAASDRLWAAFQVAPRPSLTLRVPLSKQRAQPKPQLVRGGLVVQATPITSLFGLVVGPGDIPLEGALVEMPHLQLSERTDRHGRFQFASVPAGSPVSLRVQARGQATSVRSDEPTSASEPLVIHFDTLEG